MEPVFKNINRPRENTLTFQLSPTHVAYANTLRRLSMCYVETVGFRADIRENGQTSDVEVMENSTPMTNEMLAHRIGLLPIYVKTPLEWDPEKYTFILNKVNDTEQAMDVFASDFQVMEKHGDETIQVPTSKFFKPHNISHETSLIAVLKPLTPGGKPEEIRLKAKATVGIGRENARFIPTAQCAYSYTRDQDPIHIKQVFDEWLDKNKKIAPDSLKDDDPRKGPLMREFNTLQINRCYLKDEGGEPYSFDFTIESIGVLDPEAIVLRACEKGVELCKKYAVDNLPSDVIVQRIDGQLLGYDFIFQKQDHTLGHLIQAWLDQNLVGRESITFAGYDIPHPLRDEMVIRIGVADSDEATARKALKMAMVACEAMFETWKQQWSSLVQPAQPKQIPTQTAPKTVKRIIRRLPSQ